MLSKILVACSFSSSNALVYLCVVATFSCPRTDAIVIGVAEEWKLYVNKQISELNSRKPIFYAKPGATRQYSIYNALKIVKENGFDDNSLVIIHDAARPLVSHELINRCYDACEKADGAMPVLAVKDTTYYSEDGKREFVFCWMKLCAWILWERCL